jgi:hypothetical protein
MLSTADEGVDDIPGMLSPADEGVDDIPGMLSTADMMKAVMTYLVFYLLIRV